MRYFFPDEIVREGFLGALLYGKSGATLILILVLGFLACAVSSYLLGSINSAVIISKRIYGNDVRGYGSGNAGMTNMFRTFGKKAGLLTLAGDVLKALFSVVIGFLIMGGPGQYVSGLFCMLGHVFPLYHKFKGGKGVIVSAITVLLIDPLVFLVLVLIFGLMFAATQIISASSITAAFFYPMVVYAFNLSDPNLTYIFFSLMISFFVIGMHKENIIRLLNKTEKKFTIGKGKEKKKD
ncbi:MAG: glycerol-3-phosphate 1-O-acyltransferase PlsY [Clostridia bacterium]|nr:glycerol-3-phosphate 1-O-acyltransferase PlsY [Clostridia bacterium]